MKKVLSAVMVLVRSDARVSNPAHAILEFFSLNY